MQQDSGRTTPASLAASPDTPREHVRNTRMIAGSGGGAGLRGWMSKVRQWQAGEWVRASERVWRRAPLPLPPCALCSLSSDANKTLLEALGAAAAPAAAPNCTAHTRLSP